MYMLDSQTYCHFNEIRDIWTEVAYVARLKKPPADLSDCYNIATSWVVYYKYSAQTYGPVFKTHAVY